MPVISLRVSAKDEQKIIVAARKSAMAKSEYIRRILFSSENFGAKIDFYSTINESIAQIARHAEISTQLICHILANQTNPETVQKIIETIQNNLEDENDERRF